MLARVPVTFSDDDNDDEGSSNWGRSKEGDNDDDDDDDDTADHEYAVDRILDYRRSIDGDEEYLVHWAPPYNQTEYDTWEPVKLLANCAAAINEFHHHSGKGLTQRNGAIAELAHQLREQEAAAKAAKQTLCVYCGKSFMQLMRHRCPKAPE
jgi:hypothetical protein